MRILFTGGSSFTGMWFAHELAASGHTVVATFTRPRLEAYDGLRRRRSERLLQRPNVTATWATSFGDAEFLEVVKQRGPWDVLCHHGSDVTNYKSTEFDVAGAVRSNTLNARAVLETFAANGGRAMIYTGSYFEPDEGTGTEPLEAFSPYGLSKKLSWEVFRFWCSAMRLKLGKYVLPNPFGPYEEERLCSHLIRAWLRGDVPVLSTPDYIRDNAPVQFLAREYNSFVSATMESAAARSACNPSGWVEPIHVFAERVGQEIGKRCGKTFECRVMKQTDFREPLVRQNLHPLRSLQDTSAMTEFWDSYSQYYLRGTDGDDLSS